MNFLTSNHRFLAITIVCSVLVHLVGLWFLGAIERTIRIDIASQKHINVRLAAAAAAPESSPKNIQHTAPSKAPSEKEPKKVEPTKALATPLKQLSEMAQVTKQESRQLEKKAPEPVNKTSTPASKELVTSRKPGPVSEQDRNLPVSVQENKTKPEPVIQMQPDNQTEVHETTSPTVPSIPRYQLGSAANPKPDYPMLARKKGWQGDVILGVHLQADGSIKHLTFVKSTDYGVLNHAAYETVRTQWRFDPLEGEEALANSYIEVPISFRVN